MNRELLPTPDQILQGDLDADLSPESLERSRERDVLVERFSLMEINRHSEPMNSVLRALDPGEALQKVELTSGCASTFGGVEICRYTSEDLEELLRSLGFRIVAIYGVLCVTGYIYDNEPKYDPEFMSQLERLEESMSTRLPFSQIVRYVQVLAKRS